MSPSSCSTQGHCLYWRHADCHSAMSLYRALRGHLVPGLHEPTVIWMPSMSALRGLTPHLVLWQGDRRLADLLLLRASPFSLSSLTMLWPFPSLGGPCSRPVPLSVYQTLICAVGEAAACRQLKGCQCLSATHAMMEMCAATCDAGNASYYAPAAAVLLTSLSLTPSFNLKGHHMTHHQGWLMDDRHGPLN